MPGPRDSYEVRGRAGTPGAKFAEDKRRQEVCLGTQDWTASAAVAAAIVSGNADRPGTWANTLLCALVAWDPRDDYFMRNIGHWRDLRRMARAQIEPAELPAPATGRKARTPAKARARGKRWAMGVNGPASLNP